MDLTDLLPVLRRRWLTAAVVFVLVVAASVLALAAQKPVYESSATVGLVPAADNATDLTQSLALLGQSAALLPLYSEAYTSSDTQRLARTLMPDGEALASVSVTTFASAPTILRLNTRSTSPRGARDSARAYLAAVSSRVQSGDVGINRLVTLEELNSPQLPTTPVSPHKKLTLGIGVLLALAAAVAAAFVRENTGGKIEDAEELAQAAALPVFAEIPEARGVAALTSVPALLQDDRLRFVNESMRDLGLTLQLTQFESDSVLVTSPEGRHGKTTVAFGIAVALARSGVQTVLVDGDLRRGRLEQLFVDEPGVSIEKHPGLVDVLRGTQLEDALQPTSLANLSVLTSGVLQEDPSQLLDVAFPAVLRELERRSAVVIDGTPLVPINDARVMAKFCGSTLLVAAAGGVTKPQVTRALDRLRILGVPPTAVILNRVRQRHSPSYSTYLARRDGAEGREGVTSEANDSAGSAVDGGHETPASA